MEAALNREEMIHSNPLLFNTGDTLKRRFWIGMGMSWRWDDDVVFRNQGKTEKRPKRFINDTIRNDFHVNFMNTVFRQWSVCFDSNVVQSAEYALLRGVGFVPCLFMRFGSLLCILLGFLFSSKLYILPHFHTLHPSHFQTNKQTNNDTQRYKSFTPSNAVEHTQHASPRRPGTT